MTNPDDREVLLDALRWAHAGLKEMEAIDPEECMNPKHQKQFEFIRKRLREALERTPAIK